MYCLFGLDLLVMKFNKKTTLEILTIMDNQYSFLFVIISQMNALGQLNVFGIQIQCKS